MTDKKLSFTIKGDAKDTLVSPRWTKVESEGTRCPDCSSTMIVVLGHQGLLYAYCPRCDQYFLGE